MLFTCFAVVPPIQHALADFTTKSPKYYPKLSAFLPGKTGPLLQTRDRIPIRVRAGERHLPSDPGLFGNYRRKQGRVR